MTEAEWLDCTSPRKMLGHLRGKATDRKYRLLGVACCRRLEKLFPVRLLSTAVDLAELYADGLIDETALRITRNKVESGDGLPKGGKRPGFLFYFAVSQLCALDISYTIATILEDVIPDMVVRESETPVQCNLVREIFGNPFRISVVDPGWLNWNGGVIRRLLEGIYTERSFDLLPILADALEEANCTDADILAHCRQPGDHVRGCWVVDLLLGKN